MASRYALLVSPSANRVYAAAAPRLTVAELGVLGETALDDRLGDAIVEEIAGVEYVTFAGDLKEDDLAHLANVSTAFALFERVGDDTFRPVPLRRLDCLDDDLLTILKYQGKTQELFTKLLLNVTVLSSCSAGRMLTGRLRVLDPLCGRGTTLNQALMYGWHASGLDVDERDFDAYAAFLPRWLKDKRIKHTAQTSRLRRDGSTLGRRFDVRFATTKEAWAAGDVIRVSTALVDTRRAAEAFKAASFDVVVTDAPYGVQHGSASGGRLQRRPLDLLTEALPGWVRLLKPGGAVGVAVNVRTCPRAEALAALADAGLEPRDTPAYGGFEHRVDQAIVRDLVVGVNAV
ncbi:MAG: SAM-dependent methyltransferase [Nocardioides sp.]|nr:SAM-dependent methyltransferase [Nocardioides sp.]